MSQEPNFEGVTGSSCEHHTVGPHRAWCHTCLEWCYPSAPCVRCEKVVPVDWPGWFRAAAEVADQAGTGEVDGWVLRQVAVWFEAPEVTSPRVVEAIGRALLGEETP